MNKKGFTLIELLAVIIILSLLAFLASTSVTKVVKDSKSDLYSAQIELIKAAAEAWGADNLSKLPESGECKYLNLSNLKGYGLLDSSITNPKTNKEFSDDLKIKITSNETGYGNIDTIYEVDPKSVTGCIEVYPAVCTYVDSEDDKGIAVGTIDLSDVVTCGTESFYVMSNNGKVVTALAAKNITLDLVNPIQSDSAGTIGFSYYNGDPLSAYWRDETTNDFKPEYADKYVYDSNSLLYPYVEAYRGVLEELGEYIIDVKLMNSEQYYSIKHIDDSTNWEIEPKWLQGNYWLGFIEGDVSWDPTYTCSTSDCGFPYGAGSASIRPVVNISAYAIKPQES